MRFFLVAFTISVSTVIFSTSCSKTDNNPPRIDSTTRLDSAAPTNTWTCTIDGKTYSGVIDTSFSRNSFTIDGVDTVFTAAGTSPDKKNHILFNVAMNRKRFPATGINQSFNTYLAFDSSTSNRLTSYLAGNPAINYTIDTLNKNYVVASYSGTLLNDSGRRFQVTGKFSCTLNTGNNEPSKFSCELDGRKIAGYFMRASVTANTLILNGLEYTDLPYRNFRLLVRTGGTIKPGTYKSSDGDVSLLAISPGYTGVGYYVDDTSGSLNVIIDEVNGDIVKGRFDGATKTLRQIKNGTFICRVTDYMPQTDGANRWGFSAWVDPAFSFYNCFAGNILSASRSTINGRYYLTILGESDHGKSSFKIVLSSLSPITRGPYAITQFENTRLDTLYFKSGTRTWDGTVPRLWADASTYYSGDATTVFIHSIDNNQVSGTFYNYIFNNLDDVYFGASASKRIQKAKFNAVF